MRGQVKAAALVAGMTMATAISMAAGERLLTRRGGWRCTMVEHGRTLKLGEAIAEISAGATSIRHAG